MSARRRYTVADVRRTYDARRAREERYGDWASALVYRPLSFGLTPVLLALGVTANAVTVATLALALALPLLAAALGTQAHAAIGVVGFACMVLDCVDGNIARATGASSELGGYLDFLADIVYRVSMYGVVGYIADAEGASPAGLAGFACAAGLLAACISVSARLCRFRDGRAAALTYYTADEAASDRGGVLARVVFPLLSGSERMLPVLVVVTAAAGGLGWVVIWLLALAALDFVYTQLVVIARLRSRS